MHAACNVGSQRLILEEVDYPTYDPAYHKRVKSRKHLRQPSAHRHDHLDHAPFKEQQVPHFVRVAAGSKGWRQHTRRFCLVCNPSRLVVQGNLTVKLLMCFRLKSRTHQNVPGPGTHRFIPVFSFFLFLCFLSFFSLKFFSFFLQPAFFLLSAFLLCFS